MKHKQFEYKKIKIKSVNIFDVNTTNIIIVVKNAMVQSYKTIRYKLKYQS